MYVYKINARVADHVKETTELYTRLRGVGGMGPEECTPFQRPRLGRWDNIKMCLEEV
jgi:hypothetical protein